MGGIKSIKKNFLYNALYQLLTYITPLITTPYVSRVLGADGIGRISYAESIVANFALFAGLGISVYGQREISYHQDSKYDISVIFWETKITGSIIAIIVFIAYFLFAIINSDRLIFLIMSFNLLSVAIDITWFFQGLEEFGKIVLRNTIIRLISVLYVFIFVSSHDDILKYAFGNCFFIFLGNISLWRYLPSYLCKIDHTDLKIFRNLDTIISMFLPSIAMTIYTTVDKIMIGIITGNAYQNGYYEQSMKISRMALYLLTATGSVIAPKVGLYYKKNETQKLHQLMYKGYQVTWFLGVPMSLGLIGISNSFIPWFFGEDFIPMTLTFKILSLLVIIVGIGAVTANQYLVPVNKQKYFTISTVLGAGINFVLNMIFIRTYGSVGAAGASLISELFVTLSLLYFIRNDLQITRILQIGWKYLFAGIVMLVILLIEDQFLNSSIISTILMIISGSMVYIVVQLMMGDEFFRRYCEQLLVYIKKR